ncbi:MAG TPA: hypothetical protein VFA20_27895 [Myxococcaceae bacterium]|nr:hypothetical protein [Myxococcaceae bacterium]
MTRARPTALAVLAALASGEGCTSGDLHRLAELSDQPQIEVTSIAASFPTETAGHMEFRLAIPNRGDDPLKAISINWEVWLENHRFSTGLRNLSFDVAGREERTLYLSVPVAFRKMPLRRGSIWQEIGLRGKIQVLFGDATEPIGLPFSRRMDVLCENAPIFPLPGKIQE